MEMGCLSSSAQLWFSVRDWKSRPVGSKNGGAGDELRLGRRVSRNSSRGWRFWGWDEKFAGVDHKAVGG
jgi:hypothetical protein